MADGTDNRQKVFSWLNTFLKDSNLQFSRSGFKGGADLGKHTINLETGHWGNPNYSVVKPLRWLFQIDVTVDPAEPLRHR